MPSSTLDIRPRHATVPTTLPTTWRMITIKHPGYAKPCWLLRWPAYDPAPTAENPDLWGCNHRVVLDACHIIANNRPGFLSTIPQRNDSDRVPESEYTLTADVYYYFLCDDSDPQYAIVTEFSAWSFPDVLPPHWKAARDDDPRRSMFHASESAMSTKVKALDGACVVSGVRRVDSCDNAHLVPRGEEVWFVVNRMYLYNTDPRMRRPNDVANGVCLRADIRCCLDQHAFVYYPAGTEFVAYFIEADYDYPEQFHRTVVQVHDRVSIQFLYARFALNVIANVVPNPNSWIVPTSAAYEAELANYKERKQTRPSRRMLASVTPSEESIPEKDVDNAMQFESDMCAMRRPREEVFFARFPQLRREVEFSDDHDFNTLAWHPEVDKMERLRKAWFAEHPQVRQTSSEGNVY